MRNFVRVVAVAVGLSTLSFAAGVAGDLSLADPPNFGERVVVRLPPELPSNAVRAAPLPTLSTGSIEPVAQLLRAPVTPVQVRLLRAEYLVNDGETLELAALPKQPAYGAAKPLEALAA